MRKLIWWLGLGLAMAAGEAFGALQGSGAKNDETAVLEGGFFVATCDGSSPDYANAIKFEDNGGEFTATIGTDDNYVSDIMISTAYGTLAAFKGAAIRPTKLVEGEFVDYVEASSAIVRLPGKGVWDITIDPGCKQIAFDLKKGSLFPKLDIKANPSEITLNAKDKVADPWDNQMFIQANRVLNAGEVTYIEFKYKASLDDAKTTTHCHSTPGGYISSSGISMEEGTNVVNFSTTEKTFKMTYTIPDDCAGKDMQTLAFNMAEIEQACDYTIWDVIWKLADDTESLIDQTGTRNFFVKAVGDAAPYEFGTDPNPAGSAGQEEVDGVIWYYEPHGDGTAVVTGVASNHATGNLTMPEQLGGLTVTAVGAGAFYECTNITGMAIAGGVTNIMEQAFEGCAGLTDMTIPDLVTDIGYNAFNECGGLTNLTIGAGVTNIGIQAFYSCDHLATLSLPEGLVSIGNWAFGYNALADVRIPDSVADIGEHAFDLCGRMTNVWLGTGIESVGENAFASCSYLETIWVPAEQMGTGLLDAAGLPGGCEVRYYGNVAVAFDANGGTTGSAWQAEASAEIGSNLNELLGATVPAEVEAEVVTAPAGTIFGGYGVAFGGGAETTLAPGDPIDVEVTGAATVRYLWENLYSITVTGGSSTNQFAAAGTSIDITADEPEVGEAFVQWSSNVEGLEFADAGASPTRFTMPATNVTVEAVFRPIVISGIDEAGYPYTGSAVTPDFTVALEGVDLLIGTNYTVSWVDNTNAGTAWVVVTLTNRPWGVQSNSFTIRKRAVTLTSASAEKAYDGTALTAGEVAVGGDGFAPGEGATNRVTGTQTGVGTSTNFFTYELNEGTLEGNYEVTTAEGTLTVTPRSITNAVIAEIGTQRYEGQPVRPVPTVTDGEPSIIGAGDYEVSYEGNEGPGEGTVKLTGKNNYTGETSARFTIVPAKVTLTVTAGKWGRVAVETNGVLAGRVGPDATRAFAIDYGARVVAGAVPNAGFAATNEEGTATFDSFTNDAARAYGFRPDPTNAAVRWKFSSAVGRYFAQVAVPAHAGYEEAMAGFAFLFADRTNGTGEVYAQLWNAAGRAPEGVLVTDRGVGYRGVALGTNGFKGVAEGKTAVWGVTDATLADGKTAVPAGERVVGLYVRKRVSPVTGNETAGEVENFVGYLTWKTEGVRWFLPVVEGGAGSGVARGAERAAGAGGAGRFGVMRHAYAPGTLSVAAALGLGAEAVAAGTPAVGIAEFAAGEGGAVAGRVEAVAKKGEASSSFGSGATVRVFSAGTPGGAWKEESGAKVEAATGKFQVPAREGEARFFRAVVGTREVYE